MSIVYRKDQKKIMEYKAGTMGIQAVPGAGKTFIITNLVTKLLKNMQSENTDGKILVLTYMNSAAKNFASRINKLIENEGIDKNRYEVMTIHSLAMKILKENSSAGYISDESEIIDDYRKSIFITESIEEYKSMDDNDKKILGFIDKAERNNEKTIDRWNFEFHNIVSNTIKLLKYAGIDDHVLIEKIEDDYKGIMKIIGPIFSIYQRKMRYSGYLDYDDILIGAYKIISENEDIALHYQKKYAYIFEDECQDSNAIQGKIIDIISVNYEDNISKKSNKFKRNLVRVGDVNQSITGTFTGSNPRFFVEFCKNADFSYDMNMAGRSSKDIINIANYLVEYVNMNENTSYYKSLENLLIEEVEKGKGYKENPITDKYLINTKSFENTEKEFDMVVNTIRYYKENNPTYSIGVLSFLNTDIDILGEYLESKDIEFEKLGADSKERKKVIYDLKYIVDFIIDPSNADNFVDMLINSFILRFPEMEFKDEEVLEFRKIIFDKGVSLDKKYFEELARMLRVYLDDTIRIPFTRNIEKIYFCLNNIVNSNTIDVSRFVEIILENVNLNSFESILSETIVYYIDILSRFESADLMRVSVALDKKSSRVFEPAIEAIYDIGEKEPEPGSVTLATLHKSKGMEWDAVIILDLNNNDYPSNINGYFRIDRKYLRSGYKYPEAFVNREIDILSRNQIKNMVDYEIALKRDLIEERIRLLYVGITRAKRSLLMMNSRSKYIESIGKNFTRRDSEFFTILSSFIKENRT